MAKAQGSRTHCPKGHPYDEHNTCVSGGRRHCLACGRARRQAESTPLPTWTETLWQKVSVSDGCWMWAGAHDTEGYGRYSDGLAHRLVYELLVEPIPVGLVLDHTCHNASACPGGRRCPHRSCVNPSHLEIVTLTENVMRGKGFGAVNARKVQCPAGHPYDETNTWTNSQGHRQCRTCNREARTLASGGDAR